MKKCRIVLLPLREMKITVIWFSTSKPHRTSHRTVFIKVMFWAVFLQKLSVFKMAHGYRPMGYRHSP